MNTLIELTKMAFEKAAKSPEWYGSETGTFPPTKEEFERLERMSKEERVSKPNIERAKKYPAGIWHGVEVTPEGYTPGFWGKLLGRPRTISKASKQKVIQALEKAGLFTLEEDGYLSFGYPVGKGYLGAEEGKPSYLPDRLIPIIEKALFSKGK